MKYKLLSFVLGGALTLGPMAQAQSNEPVRIGFLASLSGPVAALGQDQYDGFMLAVNLEGGKLGGVPVVVTKEDDQGKPDLANQLVQRLIEREGVSIIAGGTLSNVVVSIAKPIAEKHVLLVSSNASPSPLAGKDCTPYFFSLAAQGDQKAEVVGKFASEQGYKRVYLLAPNYQAGKDVLGGFKRMFDGEIVGETYTPLDQLDFSVELAQVAAEQPDAVYAFYPGSLGVNFVRQYQQAGLTATTPLLSTALVDGVQLPALKNAALGIWTGSFWGTELDNPANKTFVAEFEKAYGRLPSEYAAQAYDSALAIAGTLKKTGGDVSDKAALIAAMQSAPFDSIRGSLKFNTNHFPIHDMRILQVVADEKYGVNLKIVATPLVEAGDSYVDQCKMPSP